MVRDDYDDLVYRTERGEVRGRRRGDRRGADETGQPVLVGTVSIEKSEYLSELLTRQGHQARGAEREAARARGRRSSRRPASYGGVTIATNMAGRGTDIMLGGKPDDRAAGVAGRARPRRRGRRPAHHRHRAARVAPHRQPAARPLRPPGRPRQLALLRLVRGRHHAPVRARLAAGHDGASSAWKTTCRSRAAG